MLLYWLSSIHKLSCYKTCPNMNVTKIINSAFQWNKALPQLEKLINRALVPPPPPPPPPPPLWTAPAPPPLPTTPLGLYLKIWVYKKVYIMHYLWQGTDIFLISIIMQLTSIPLHILWVIWQARLSIYTKQWNRKLLLTVNKSVLITLYYKGDLCMNVHLSHCTCVLTIC